MKAVARERVPVSVGVLAGSVAAAFGRHGRSASDRLREDVAAFTGLPHISLTGSARQGIRWLLDEVVRRHGPGEALLWNYNFFAVPQVAAQAGLQPVFLDAASSCGEPDPEVARNFITPRTRAIVISHHFGRPSEMDAWCALAEEHGLDLVEDCAHAFGATFAGRHVGSFGLGGAVSLSLTKTLTGVAGGLVMSARDDVGASLAEREVACVRPGRAEVVKTLAFALAGKGLLDPLPYGLLVHAANRLAARAGLDPMDALMTEKPTPDGSRPVGERGKALSPAYASVALAHLPSVEREIAARRRVARRILDAGPWRTVEMPPDEDRGDTWLNFVVRTDSVGPLRRHLLGDGFDTRTDYIRPMVDDPSRFPVSSALTPRGVYLPVRGLVDDEATDRLVASLTRFDRASA